jgi:hypothetical protein
MANEPATRGGNGNGGITHRGWRKDMETAVTIINTIVYQFTLMQAALAKVQAGRTQRTLVNRDLTVGTGLKDQTVAYVGEIDRRYIPVGEAVAHAGGIEEVALDKRYHTVG